MKYKNYPADLRQRNCDLLEAESHTRAEVAGIFLRFLTQPCVIFTTHTDQIVLPKPKGRKKKRLQQEDIDFLKSKIDEGYTQTLEKLRDHLHLERGKKISVTTAAAEIKGFKYSLKRVVTIPNAAEKLGVRLTIQQQAIMDEPELVKRYDRLGPELSLIVFVYLLSLNSKNVDFDESLPPCPEFKMLGERRGCTICKKSTT